MLTSCHLLEVFSSAYRMAWSDAIYFSLFQSEIDKVEVQVSSSMCVWSWIQFQLCVSAVLLSFWRHFTSSFCMLVLFLTFKALYVDVLRCVSESVEALWCLLCMLCLIWMHSKGFAFHYIKAWTVFWPYHMHGHSKQHAMCVYIN